MKDKVYNIAEFTSAVAYVKDIEQRVNSGDLKLVGALETKYNETLAKIKEYEDTVLTELESIDEDDYMQDCDDMH